MAPYLPLSEHWTQYSKYNYNQFVIITLMTMINIIQVPTLVFTWMLGNAIKNAQFVYLQFPWLESGHIWSPTTRPVYAPPDWPCCLTTLSPMSISRLSWPWKTILVSPSSGSGRINRNDCPTRRDFVIKQMIYILITLEPRMKINYVAFITNLLIMLNL